jgi:hypothetical protein
MQHSLHTHSLPNRPCVPLPPSLTPHTSPPTTQQSFGATGPSERPRVPRSLAPLRPYKSKGKGASRVLFRGGGGGRRKKSNLILWFSFTAVVFAGCVFIFNGFFLTSRLLAGDNTGSSFIMHSYSCVFFYFHLTATT